MNSQCQNYYLRDTSENEIQNDTYTEAVKKEIKNIYEELNVPAWANELDLQCQTKKQVLTTTAQNSARI